MLINGAQPLPKDGEYCESSVADDDVFNETNLDDYTDRGSLVRVFTAFTKPTRGYQAESVERSIYTKRESVHTAQCLFLTAILNAGGIIERILRRTVPKFQGFRNKTLRFISPPRSPRNDLHCRALQLIFDISLEKAARIVQECF